MPGILGSQQLGGDLFSQGNRLVQSAPGLGAPDIFRQVRHGAQMELSAGGGGVSANRCLTAATHGVEKGAFGGDALGGGIVIEPAANCAHGFVVLAYLQPNGALARAGQHQFRLQDASGQNLGHSGAAQQAGSDNLNAEPVQAGGGQNGRVHFGLRRQFLQTGRNIAANRDDEEIRADGQELGLAADAAGGDGQAGGKSDSLIRGTRPLSIR